MPKLSKNKNSNARVKRLNEFPTTRLTPLRISKLRKGSHLTTPFLEAKDGEQGARAAYPKANPATKALRYKRRVPVVCSVGTPLEIVVPGGPRGAPPL